MRNAVRYLLVGGALMLPQLGHSLAGVNGLIYQDDCATIPDATSAAFGGELYITKITAPPAVDPPTDFMFDLTAKGGGVTGGTSLSSNGLWNQDDSWKFTQLAPDVHFVLVTVRPAGAGMPGRLFMDAGSLATGSFFFDGGAIREIGNAVPAGQGNTNGLRLPANASSTYTVAGKTFPVGSNTNGVNIVFSPVLEYVVGDPDAQVGVTIDCKLGSHDPNPRDAASTDLLGGIIGYNVWRIEGGAGTVPTPADFLAAHSDADPATGWVYFMDMRGFNLNVADAPQAGPGTISPVELNAASAADLAGFSNSNTTSFDGDEYLYFQDSPNNRGTNRPAGTAPPDTSRDYWYAFQPVLFGDVDLMETENVGGVRPVAFTNNGNFSGDHRRDLDSDGAMDAVDLDLLGTPEFISPQAEVGLDGLGLTNNGLPLLTSPVFYDGRPAVQLPAFGQVALTGGIAGNDVNLSFSTGLEKGTVLGYNVYRVTGDQRVRVNEQPILAQGTESNVYQLVDGAVRGRGQRSVNYMVEIVYSDGTASTMVGPFAVSLDQQPVRRRR